MSFVRKAGEREAIEKEGAQGGPGTMRAHKLINQDEELLNKGTIFCPVKHSTMTTAASSHCIRET